jgi:hypothetical protein
MPEVNELTWTHRELVELMIKAANIHEGKWMIELKLGFAPANSGPSPEQINPGVIVAVTGIGIRREIPGAPPVLVVDAAQVNPEPKS